ncbi:MAG TPA: ATP-binding protein [Thermodesulfobacteriota bacterium]|nr:ATP-binding protein [Thermodesulfobacteriota bacterium]
MNKPYPGFFFYKNLVITDISSKTVNGETLKRFKDEVRKVNGITVKTPDDVYGIINQYQVGTDIRYTIERNDSTFDVTIPIEKLTPKEMILTFGIIYVIGIVFLVIGVMVLQMKPNLRASKAFFLFCASICVWFTGSFDAQAVYMFDQLTFFAWIFSPLFGIYLMFIFPSDSKLRGITHNLASIVFLFISAMLFVLQFIFFYTYDAWKYVNTASWLYVVLSTMIFPISSLVTYMKPSSTLEKQRAQIILLGCIFGLLVPASAVACITVFKISLPYNLMALPVIIFPVSIAYAIVKHKLFDIDVIIEKALTYGLLTGAVGGVFALTVLGFNVAFAKYGGWKNPAFFVILSGFLVIALNPLKNRIQDLVDLTFFRKKYDYRGTVEEVSYAMTSLLSLEKIVDKIIVIVESTMFSNPVSVFIYNQDLGAYERYFKEGEVRSSPEASLEEDNILVQQLNFHGSEIFKEDLIADEKYIHNSQRLTSEFERLNSSLIIPLFFKKQLIGFIALGEKKSGLSYTSRDVNLLRLLANQSAIAIENALAFKLVEDYAKKLEKTNKELKDTQAQLVHAEKMSAIGQLAAGVAHEIRNPLNIIEGARYYISTYMMDKENAEVVGEYLEYIKHEIDRTNRLIDSLLKFSKAEPPYFERVNINSVLENVVILVRKQLSDNKIALTLRLDETLPEIMADPNQLWQVFINIILNAVQAMPKGGDLTVETSNRWEEFSSGDSDHIYIHFRDTGVGIEKEDINKIFDPFFTKKDMGTGLGLSIAYTIIEKHQGRIIVESEKGSGTIFTIELPSNNNNITIITAEDADEQQDETGTGR